DNLFRHSGTNDQIAPAISVAEFGGNVVDQCVAQKRQCLVRKNRSRYHPRRLTHAVPPPPDRFTHPVPPPPPLTHVVFRLIQPPPPPLIQPPRLFTQPEVFSPGKNAAPATARPITAVDHFRRPARKSRRVINLRSSASSPGF